MYINFNGHQNRQKLRKENQYLRDQYSGKRENSLTKIAKESEFPEISEKEIKRVKNRINQAAIKEKRKELVQYIIFGIIALLATLKLVSFFI